MEESIELALCLFNRATYARVRSFLSACEREKDINLTVFLGSALQDEEYGKASGIIKESHPGLKFIDLSYISHKGSEGRANYVSGDIIDFLTEHLEQNTYNACIVIGDRFETLPAAMAFSYMNVPLIHLQGGEVTGNIDERVRHAVTKLSDYHFTCTPLARKYVIKMGEESNRVFFTGCPSLDIIKEFGIRRNTPKERYIMCFFHPDTENQSEAIGQTKEVLGAVVDYCLKYGAKCYWYWPNPDPGRQRILKVLKDAHERYAGFLVKAVNLPPKQFLTQLSGARAIIGNSSVGIREASYIGVPSINIGDRQSIRERSHNVIDIQDCEISDRNILVALEEQTNAKKYKCSYLYGNGDAAKNIIAHIKRFIWTRKGHLTYPLDWEYKSEHFDRKRIERHSIRTANRRTKGQMDSSRAV